MRAVDASPRRVVRVVTPVRVPAAAASPPGRCGSSATSRCRAARSRPDVPTTLAGRRAAERHRRRQERLTTLNHRYPAIQGEFEDEYEVEFESEARTSSKASRESRSRRFEVEGDSKASRGGVRVRGEAEAEPEAEGELEDEFEDEDEEEAEGFVNPVRRIYRDAESMAHLAVRRRATRRARRGRGVHRRPGARWPSKLIPRAAS